jgi:hypothetical protein
MEHMFKPVIDDESRQYWEGLKNHKLMIQQCLDCSKYIFYPRTICPHCFSEHLKWVEANGNGLIYSYTVVHRAMPPFKDEVPYVVGIIELEEGVRMMSRIVGDRSQIAIDKPVSVIFHQIDDELTLPYFQLV